MSLRQLDSESQKLINHYKSAYIYTINQLKRQIDNGLSERHSRDVIREIQITLRELDESAYKWSQEILPEYYQYTVSLVDRDVRQLSFATVMDNTSDISMIHRNAVQVAVRDTYTDLARRTQYMAHEAKRIIRDNTSEIINRQLITGESRTRTIPELKRQLEKDGVASFVAANGAKWNIKHYSETLIRTKTRILTNTGTMNRLSEYQNMYPEHRENFDLVQISSHGAVDWCRHYEGKVFSISGNHPDYPPVASLPNGYNTLHPNCKHVFLPYMPALRGRGQTVSNQYLNRTIKDLNKEDYHVRKNS